MTNAIRELPQPLTSVPHNNSINSNSTTNNKTTPTAYITKLLSLHKRGICHTPNGKCLPNCMTYNYNRLYHPGRSIELLEYRSPLVLSEPFPIHPEPGTKAGQKHNKKHPSRSYPKHVTLQKKKQINFFKKAKGYFCYAPSIILKDYASRKNLSFDEIPKKIKKLEKAISTCEYNMKYYKKDDFRDLGCSNFRRDDILFSYRYKIAHCEQQITLLQLIKENSESPPIIDLMQNDLTDLYL